MRREGEEGGLSLVGELTRGVQRRCSVRRVVEAEFIARWNSQRDLALGVKIVVPVKIEIGDRASQTEQC